jgi:hypothetical protein
VKALTLHVERVVRPIRASERREDRMRQESLGPLVTAVADQAGLVGEDEAGRRATERLGPPDELRRRREDRGALELHA